MRYPLRIFEYAIKMAHTHTHTHTLKYVNYLKSTVLLVSSADRSFGRNIEVTL